ncbi:MAG TPA: DnaJ domain-containing protein [Solirubrobacteraceae bacterium]
MTGGGQIDYYAVLGVPRNASAPDIRRAYRRVARRHHPDLNRDPGGPERFAAAARAYEVLSDPVARARYDQRFVPNPVSISRSPSRSPRSPTAIGRRGVLELTASEAADLARRPLVLTDTHGRRSLIPAGTRHGDQLVLGDGDRLIVLRVQVDSKT